MRYIKCLAIFACYFRKFPAMTKTTPGNLVSEIFLPYHFIKPSTNPKSSHMSDYIHQNYVNVSNEPVKVEQQLLEISSEMDNYPCITITENSSDTKITIMRTSSIVRESNFEWWITEALDMFLFRNHLKTVEKIRCKIRLFRKYMH